MQTAFVCAASDRGLQRDDNEDVFVVADLSAPVSASAESEIRLHVSQHGVLLAVFDGMGGHDHGAIAACIAASTVVREMSDAAKMASTAPEERMCEALKVANRKICDEAAREFGQIGMGTTCTAALVLPERLVLAQVGDSRAYLFRKATLTQLTKDQSLVATMMEAGELSREEAARYCGSNIILQALGAREDVSPVISQVPLSVGDMILLESDGLHGQVPDDEIERILSSGQSPAACVRALVEASLDAGGHDNVTVVLTRVE